MCTTINRGAVLVLALLVAFTVWFALDVRADEGAVGNPYIGDADAIADGEQVFFDYCSECHGDGTGGTGPNLTDDEWLYGGSDADVYRSVTGGRPGGMPAMKYDMNNEEILKVIAYVRSIKK